MSNQSGPSEDLRTRAMRSLELKRSFRMQVGLYVVVIAFLWVIYAVDGAGFPWPLFPMAAWGFALVVQATRLYGRGGPSEDDIQREMRRLGG